MKKQLAVLMAAATAVTTVAPVVANAADPAKTNATDLYNKVKTDLADKLANPKDEGFGLESTSDLTGDKAYLNSKYLVVATLKDSQGTEAALNETGKEPADFGLVLASRVTDYTSVFGKHGIVASSGAGTYVVTDADKFRNLLELRDNGSVEVTIYKKAVDEKGNSNAVVGAKQLYTYGTAVTGYTVKLDDANVLPANLVANYIDKIEKVSPDGKKTTVQTSELATLSATADKLLVTFKNGKTFEMSLGGVAYDFTKGLDGTGNELAFPSGYAADDAIKNSIAGFPEKTVDSVNDENKVALGVASVEKLVLFDVYSVENIDLGTVYTADNGYTEDGAKKVTNLGDLYKATDSYNYNGVTYDRNGTPSTEITANGDKGYVLTVTVPVVNHNDAHVKRTLQFKIAGASQADLVQVKTDIVNGTDVVAGRFKRIVGADRYQTAIEASKVKFNDEDGNKFAESVVIVGGNALLDGLSAAPLASAKDATVLLAHPKSGLSADTLAEIKRATDEKLKNKTVYIVGGTDSVPASVEKDLENLGAVVIRIAGADRYATSKAIAERLVYDGQATDTTFFVGGNGAADAMSIAPVASRIEDGTPGKVSPILVVKKDDIPQDTRNFLLKDKVAKKAYIVGGVNSVGTGVYSLLNGASITTERISGADRYDTNIQVLKTFYGTPKATGQATYIQNAIAEGKVTGLYVASGADKALVDAQVIGAYARSTEWASGTKKTATYASPILLVGNKLTDDQIKLMNSTGIFGSSAAGEASAKKLTGGKVYQVGGAVSSDAMKVIVDKLDLH